MLSSRAKTSDTVGGLADLAEHVVEQMRKADEKRAYPLMVELFRPSTAPCSW